MYPFLSIALIKLPRLLRQSGVFSLLEQARSEYVRTLSVQKLASLHLRPRPDAEKMAKNAFSDWKAKDVVVKEFDMPKRPSGVTVNFVPRTGAVQSNIIISHPAVWPT